jgi:hypothetical protein
MKEKSGLLKHDRDEFGAYHIEKIPPIYETRGPHYTQLSQSETELLVLDMSLLAVNPKDLPKVSPHHPTRNIYLFGTNACYLFFIRGLFMVCSNQANEFDTTDAPVATIDWDTKLLHATRLLNTAWAMAEAGGVVEAEDQAGERIYRISRSFNRNGHRNAHCDGQTSTFTSPEIDAIRDLYPRRIGEISDLGKLFAAACMVLRLALVPTDHRAALEADIDALVSSLHNAHSLQNSPTHGALVQGQKRYNGHLEACLTRAADCLRYHQNRAYQPLPTWQKRDRLIAELFLSLWQARR